MKKALLSVCILCVLIFVSCGKKGSSSANAALNGLEMREIDLTPPADALFQKMASSETGITFKNDLKEDWTNNVLTFPYLYNAGGVGVIDVNNDGLQDVYFTSTVGACKLYLNKGNFKFEDISANAGVEASDGIKCGVTIADVNGDGWQDIYLIRTGIIDNDNRRNLLFINNQNGTFSEKAKEMKLDDGAPHTIANFFDYDLDGDLDCFMANHPSDFKTVQQILLQQDKSGKTSRVREPKKPEESDKFFKNDNGIFKDVTREAGLIDMGFTLSATITDLNFDGYPDLIVGNDYVEHDKVYINNKNGTFSDKSATAFRHMSQNTMGADIADINNDGLPDAFFVDMLAEDYKLQKARITTAKTDRYNSLVKYGFGRQEARNQLQLNNGNGTFSEIGCLAGVFQTDWSWASLIQDFDNDGWRDIYVSNGYYRDITNADYLNYTVDSVRNKMGGLSQKTFPNFQDYLNLIPQFKLLNYAYQNKGDLTFEDVSVKWGLATKSYSNGIAYADFDNDGDMDLMVNNIEDEAFVYKNRAVDMKKGNWLQIKLEGSEKNRQAFGAKAKLSAAGQIFYAELSPSRGFVSSVEPIFHFGLGNLSTIEKVEVEFPGGKLLTYNNVSANQRLQLKYSDAKAGKIAAPTVANTLFKETKAPDFVHVEEDFLDFNRERLIPWKMSTPGPRMASADVNGDKLPDFFVGNAIGTVGALFIQNKAGGFSQTSTATFEADKAYEDSGCAFFDADGDGDQDLLVASGGNTAAPNATVYVPRLYINDGKGNFAKATDRLPAINDAGSAVAAADFDDDGDQDVFIGGWCLPGSYPLPATSHLLMNDGRGRFSDVTNQVTNDLSKIGIIYQAVWSDLDGDKLPELILAGEWMPITIFKNKNGKLFNATANYGLENTQGFWRSLALADLDEDGDLDISAGNFGLNSRYKATVNEPLRLYAKDFDNNGSIDPIMTLVQYGEELPIAYRDVIVGQLPSLKKKFLKYTPYANARVHDLYAKKELDASLQLSCKMLANGWFEQKEGKFIFHAYPNIAQIAPVFAQIAQDINKDGKMDLILVGNDYGQQVETGPIDAGNGLILLGTGGGNFSSLHAAKSGLWASKEVRSLLALTNSAGKTMLIIGNNNTGLQVFQ